MGDIGIAEHPAQLEGAPNFRDMAGYKSSDGRRVRPGKLYRSEALVDLTEKDLARIAALGIDVICDLRSPEERTRDPNRWPEGRPVDVIALDAGSEMSAVKASRWHERLIDPDFKAEQARGWMLHAYARMPHAYARDLAAVFDRLDAPHTPSVLVHCAAGKDRTGFCCAMLLWALDVPWDTIVADYLESSRRRPPDEMVQRVLKRYFNSVEPFAMEALHVIAGVSVDFLTNAIKVVEQEFGTVDVYLEKACGLHADRRSRLRERLLLA